jgi:hypothetical protein
MARANAAGTSPHRNTHRHDVAGSPGNHTPWISHVTAVARNMPSGAAVYRSAPASTRRFSGTTSATIAAPAAHSPPMPRLAIRRNSTSTQMFGANAHAAVPNAYTSIVSSRVRERPMRSATRPNATPPMAHPTSSTLVMTPVHHRVRGFAAGSSMARPSRVGTQLGATKLNSRPSNTSKPQPSHAANRTVHW